MPRIALFLMLAACGGSGGDSQDAYPPELPLDEAYTACEIADDCTAVELGCCDECNGGFAVAARTDSASELQEIYGETCDENTACTEMGCPPWEVTCVDATCAIARGEF